MRSFRTLLKAKEILGKTFSKMKLLSEKFLKLLLEISLLFLGLFGLDTNKLVYSLC